MGSTNMKRNLLRKFRAEKLQTETALDSHFKQWGRCLSECVEGNQLRERIVVLTHVIEEVLNA